MYSYDITVALANDRRSKLQADAARSHEARGPDRPARPPAVPRPRWLADALAAPSGPRLCRCRAAAAAPIDRAV